MRACGFNPAFLTVAFLCTTVLACTKSPPAPPAEATRSDTPRVLPEAPPVAVALRLEPSGTPPSARPAEPPSPREARPKSESHPVVRHKDVKRRHDRFEDDTFVETMAMRLKVKRILLRLKMRAMVRLNGKDRVLDRTFIWLYVSYPRPSCEYIGFIADGQRVAFNKTEYQYSQKRVWGDLKYDELVRLAWAKKVEGKVCQFEFMLTDDQIQVLRAFESELREPSDAVAAAKGGARANGK